MHTDAQRHMKNTVRVPLLFIINYSMRVCFVVFLKETFKSCRYMPTIFALKTLDSFSWSAMKGLSVNNKQYGLLVKVILLHVDLIYTLMNSNLRQRSYGVFPTYYWGFLCFWVNFVCYPVMQQWVSYSCHLPLKSLTMGLKSFSWIHVDYINPEFLFQIIVLDPAVSTYKDNQNAFSQESSTHSALAPSLSLKYIAF